MPEVKVHGEIDQWDSSNGQLCKWNLQRSPLKLFSWNLIPCVQRILVLICASFLLICFRLWMLNGQLPQFSDQDNPAAFSPFLLTRGLTYSYLAAFNAWLLLAPITLSYDWQMGSIPLVETPIDLRNAATLGVALALVLLLRYGLIMVDEDEEKSVLVGLAFLVFPFLPASNLFVKVGFVVAERVLYLPSVGLCVLVTHGYHRLRSTLPRRRLLLRLAMLTVIVFFAAKTVQRNLVWRTRDTLFLSGLQTLPHNAKMHYNFANLQKDSGNNEKAIEHYRITLRLWPSHASAHNNLGTLLSNKTEALGHFLKAIEINPRHARAHYNLANILRDDGQIQESVEAMQIAAALEPTYPDALMGLAGLYEEVGRTHDAEQLHHALLRMEPQSADAYNNYGAFLQRTGRDNEAQHYYQRAISLEPNHTVALINAARLFRSLKHNSQAEDLYKRALLVQEDPQIQSNLAVLYLNTGRTLDARAVLERILEQHPHHLEAKVHYAQALIRERNFHQAETMLLSVIDINPTHRDALHQLANLYNHINRTTEALDYILQALKICSTDDVTCGQLHADYGNILKDLNDMDTAAQSYKMAVQVNPNLSHAHLNLGVIYHIKREFQLAWQHYRAAQILEPHNQLLLDNMEKLRRTELRLASLSTTERSCS